jgi:hypothetical protein
MNLRDRLRQILIASILVLVGLAAFAWIADYAIFRVRLATNRSAFGSVKVSHYYAILQKSGKTQLIFDPPQPENCVNALFSHAGSKPCWYLRRHPEQRTDI